ncbi:MAG TPA: bifunctional phosphoribosylaminoimidazolecarboxamide formyltransferase/IMP cyclohydrolase [Gemmatimonadales bacterium]|nr:bifunctional phosphoribosylaminoimidazolecarboxamide formyltransferase/IMP cyclohydrolase [Gemmatimonadales bacterium]
MGDEAIGDEAIGDEAMGDGGMGRVVRALLSVSDKRGLVDFARALVEMGWEIVSTGGTADALRREGITVIPIDQVTGFPEMMDGRVKTLHPKVHGGLLGRRDNKEHMAAMREHGITPIDLVAVNLYPFRETVAKSETTFEQAIEQIDIGGPSMLRSAAKNHHDVIVIVDPADYGQVIEDLKAGGVGAEKRRALAAKVFAHTAAYDAAILSYLTRSSDALPSTIVQILQNVQPLRYGENPHQRAALYATDEPGIRDMRQLHGKELSFNNLLDVDAAVMAVAPWQTRDARVACVIIKHTTPCGIALGRNAADAYTRALATDRTSAFGSVIAFNTVVDRAAAEAMRELFVEVVVAPRVDADALAVFREKKNLRVVELPRLGDDPTLDFKRVRGGFLVQDRFRYSAVADESKWKVATTRHPTEAQWNDLRFAWAAVGSIKSNAIVLVKEEAAIGIGAGQMSRVDSSFLAVHKARQQGHDPAGAVLASDAFFPFRDGVDEAAAAGVSAIIQPGGSVKDAEVIAAADEHGLAMILTGMRQFRH